MGAIIKYRAFSLSLEYRGIEYTGTITPIIQSNKLKSLPTEFSVVLNGRFRGIFNVHNTTWQSTLLEDELLVNEIGKGIYNYYE